MMRRFFLKLYRRRNLENDLETELSFHREMSRQSQNDIPLGNTAVIKENALDLWRFSVIENLWRDVIYAVRGLRRSPALLICALLSLGLGIGANTAIFQLLDALRLRLLPVQKPDELAAVRIMGGNRGMGINPGEYPELTRPIWQEIQSRQEGFSGMFAWTANQVNIGEGSELRRVKAMWVSEDYFHVLGVRPWRGRPILPEDVGACPGLTAVVSYFYWQSALGSNPIDGSMTLLVDGVRKHIIGVTPPDFAGLSVGDRFDIVLPLCRQKELSRNVYDIAVMGRLRPGWTLNRASEQLQALSPAIFEATVPSESSAQSIQTYKRFRLAAYPAAAGVSLLRQQYDSSLWLLLAITALVLLIACANLANLLLARASTRDREMAVRLALGASRNRLFRQLLVEGALLAATGAIVGISLAQIFSRLLVWALSTEGNSVVLPLTTDWRVLLFTASLSALTCIVFAVVPAQRAVNAEPVSAMKAAGRGLTAGYQRFLAQRLLVVIQIAVSLVLLVGALLFVRSFRNLMTFDPGMREANITIAFLAFQRSHVAPGYYTDFQRQLLEEVRSIPGVLHAASTTNIPLVGGSWEHGVRTASAEGMSKFTWVSPGYFDTMKIPLIMGRDFNQRDTSGSQRVAVVNQTFVRRYLGNANPIGQTLRTGQEPGYPSTLYQVVGVITDTKYNDIRGETPPMAFAPAPQNPDPGPFAIMLVHSNAKEAKVAAAIKRSMTGKHPEVVVTAGDFQASIRDSLVTERVMAILSGLFGFMAALLAIIGLYGVISYLVVSRQPEIGVRMALGAARWQVIGLIMKEAVSLLFIGTLAGTVLSLIAGRSTASMLFGLKPYDPLTLVAAALLLAAISILASFLPARRASKLDPMIALRYE
jgi:predicted permease